MHLHLAEIARERDLRRRRQVDVAEQTDLAGERPMQRLDLERPVAPRVLRPSLSLRHDDLPAGACSGEVVTGSPTRTCAKYRKLEQIRIPPERDLLWWAAALCQHRNSHAH